MHHQGKVTRTDGLRPFHAECSCASAGDFLYKNDAVMYLKSHFQNIGVVETSELIDAVIESVPAVEEESSAEATSKKKGPKK